MDSAILDVLDNTISALFPIALAALPFMVVGMGRHAQSVSRSRLTGLPPVKFPILSVSCFGIPILLTMFLSTVLAECGRREVLEYLSGLQDAEVFINGAKVADAEAILADLRSVAPKPAHHSHPTGRVCIVVRSAKGVLDLELGRDSGDSAEYWVFYRRYRSTTRNEIGRIDSYEFGAY